MFFFINESKSISDLNSIKDIDNLLFESYLKKAFMESKYYCMNPRTPEELGPYTIKQIESKLAKLVISKQF